MKINHIETINLCYEYPPARQFEYAGGICNGRLTTLIRVHTDTDETGIGSVYSHPALVYLIVRDQLAPLLIGEDPRDTEALWDKMYGITRWYGRKGAALSALGGIDVALWDLRGKATGKPVYQLLGAERQTCPIYASALLWNDIQTLADEAAGYVDAGFQRMKMRLARSEDYDLEAVKTVREVIGPDRDLMVDASMRYHLPLAQRMSAFFKAQGVLWCEEPFAPERLDLFKALHDSVNVGIAAGENEFGLDGFRTLIESGGVDFVQPDVVRSGGITDVVRIGQLAHEHGLHVVTHSWNDAVAVIANAHAVAAMPNGFSVEIDKTGTPFIDSLLEEPLQIQDGKLQLPQGPGLGITLNETVVEQYRLADPLTIPEGVYSDMMFGKAYFPPSLPYLENVLS